MRNILYPITLFICYLSFSTSCTKPSDNPATTDIPLGLTNDWQCKIDGIDYNGTVDTSFLEIVFGSGTLDSVIVCTGTSADKKAQIHFKLSLNRTKFPSTGINNSSNTYLVFDTSANNLFHSTLATNPPYIINYKLDSITGQNLVISYSGSLTDYKQVNHTINGKFRCRLFSGNSEPNKFYCLLDSSKRYGYFTSAQLNANTLIMVGVDYMDNPTAQFRIIVRTGGTIKPGIYTSKNGDVAFNSIAPVPSIKNYYYVDDSYGDMTVTIKSVNDNIVEGSFSGVNKTLNKIEGGRFICRVTNYSPKANATNRWAFGAWIDPSFGNYNCYAGNITSAIKTNVAGIIHLSISGETDNGASSFKIVVSNPGQIIKGEYRLIDDYNYKLDTIYFKSGVATWDGIKPNFYANNSTIPRGGQTYCFIDSIDDKHVVGRFYGVIANNLEDNFYGSSQREIHKASFNAAF